MNKNALFALAAVALFSGCASAPRAEKDRSGSLVLPGFAPRKGGHCESSAMLNALAYLGYDVTEADIVGGGGAPSFVFTNDGFPFVGGRNERMREIFLETAGIPYGVVVPGKGDDGWNGIFALLERGVPVLLRVDMRWLPYLYGGKYGPAYMSFGWHVICLYGVDFDSGEALVTDTDHGGPCRIALRDLEKARSSTTKVYPPRREYAWIEPKPADWVFDPDALLKGALAAVLSNYDSIGHRNESGRGGGSDSEASFGVKKGGVPLSGLAGLAAFPEFLASFHTAANPFVIAPAYSYMAGSIERNGTGGAAFRVFFRDFLEARAADCADPDRRAAAAALVASTRAAAAAWSDLAAAFARAAEEIEAATGSAKNAAMSAAEAATAERARSLHYAERALRDAIAAAID